MNTRVPRPWEAKVNNALANKAQERAERFTQILPVLQP
ncbi:hypothetical protein LSPH24S_04373 [Lysinibacillus sphaericus]